MNQLKKCTAIKALLSLVSLCALTLAQAAPVGTVTNLSGPLRAKKADGTVRVLGARSAVETGDTLSTQGKGYAQIKFTDDSVLILQPDTTLTIDKFSYDVNQPAADSIAFTLVQGGVRSNTGILGKRSKDSVQMTTPAANVSMQAANAIVRYVKPSAEALAFARHAYLMASTAALDSALQTVRSDMPAPGAGRPLMLAQINPLSTPGLPSGLYLQVVQGLIQVTNPAGSLNFAAGQFGYTSNPSQAPIVVPKNPGLNFSPPVAFNTLPPASNPGSAPKSNVVDCEVR